MGKKAKRQGPAAVLGGMIAGFDQQVFRTTPPPHELAHHARPDDPVPTKDGGMLLIGIPGLMPPGAPPLETPLADEEPEATPVGDEPATQAADPDQAEVSSSPDARR